LTCCTAGAPRCISGAPRRCVLRPRNLVLQPQEVSRWSATADSFSDITSRRESALESWSVGLDLFLGVRPADQGRAASAMSLKTSVSLFGRTPSRSPPGWNEVGAPLQDDLDIRPCRVHAIALRHQVVADAVVLAHGWKISTRPAPEPQKSGFTVVSYSRAGPRRR